MKSALFFLIFNPKSDTLIVKPPVVSVVTMSEKNPSFRTGKTPSQKGWEYVPTVQKSK